MHRYQACALLTIILALVVWTAFTRHAPTLPLVGRHGDAFYLAILDPLARENACPCMKNYAQRDYGALATHLGARLRRRVKLAFGENPKEAEEQLGHEPDLLIGPKSLLASAGQPLGRLIALLTDREGVTTVRGLFVVRADAPARRLADLRGRSLLMGPKNAEERHEIAFAAMRASGVEVPGDPQTRETSAEAAAEVAEREADAAVISSYSLPLLIGCKLIGPSELRVIGHTEPVPFIAAYATRRVPPNEFPSVRHALLSIRNDADLLRKLESTNGFVSPPLPTRLSKGWTDWGGSPVRDSQSLGVPTRLPVKTHFLWRRRLASQSLGGVAATPQYVIVSDKTADDQKDVWRCFQADTGEQVWQLSYPAAKAMDYTSSPRATPVIVEDKVYLLGALGDLHCVALDSGKVLWRVNLTKRFGGKVPTWGFCSTPLALGHRLIVNTSSPHAALVALNRHSGRPLWTAPGHPPGYGNMIVGVFGGKRQIVGHDAVSAGGWDVNTGRRLWTLAPPEEGDFNVPTPARVGERLLLATEKNGARLYEFHRGGLITPNPVALNAALHPSTTTPVLVEGLVWGSCDTGTYCLDPKEGLHAKWHSGAEAYREHTCLIAGNGRVLICLRNGEIALLPSPSRSDTKPETLTVFPTTGDFPPEVWSCPALVGNRLYLRSEDEAVCLLLREDKLP
ncbi:MAG: PQQ-binding-like beta-propeller repeat protein [Armatimonadetes bacterium]|nr:PQQ-binding-like beta-propeller repeat protein [Armatimonadota bacterium]